MLYFKWNVFIYIMLSDTQRCPHWEKWFRKERKYIYIYMQVVTQEIGISDLVHTNQHYPMSVYIALRFYFCNYKIKSLNKLKQVNQVDLKLLHREDPPGIIIKIQIPRLSYIRDFQSVSPAVAQVI